MTYEYTLYASRYGGEHTIGTISNDVAEYWLDKGDDAFAEYMMDGDHDVINEDGFIPKDYQLPIWYEVDDIEHMFTVEFADGQCLCVEDAKTGETVAEIKLTDDLLGRVHNPFADNNDFKGKSVVYGQTFEKGGFPFENLVTDEPFDVSKLKFNVTEWDNLKLVDTIEYDGQSLCVEGDGDTMEKSQACWIDEDSCPKPTIFDEESVEDVAARLVKHGFPTSEIEALKSDYVEMHKKYAAWMAANKDAAWMKT